MKKKEYWYIQGRTGKLKIIKVIKPNKIIAQVVWPSKGWINRDKYKGVGRPRKSDYYTGMMASSGSS